MKGCSNLIILFAFLSLYSFSGIKVITMALVIYDWATCNPNLEEDLKLMKNKAKALFARAADISTEVTNAELHPEKKRRREVENWMKRAEEIKMKMDYVEEEVEQQSSLSNRKRLRKEILEINKEMEDLLEHAGFQNGLTIHDLASSSLSLVTTKMKGQEFENNLRMILSWLTTNEVSKIGVYGMGGAGKTTLATHIHDELLHILGPASVCWVTVSQECTVLKLQQKIGKELGLPADILETADEMKRPAILSKALKKRSNVVIILDDMWEYLPMERVGLQTGNDQFKLLLITRSVHLCRRMGCQKSVKVEPLSEEESWSLFAEKLGDYDDLSLEAKDIAKLVAKECAGLPLGVIVVAASMRGVLDVCEWNNALEELTNSTRIHEGIQNEVFPSLQLSYSRLDDVTLQNCFLSCALYPEDSKLKRDNLLNLWIMEGHLEEIQSRQEQLNKAHTMLNRLISACLLDATDSTGDYVKMHDLIRDMAIRISRQRHNTMIKAGKQLRVVPRVQEWTEDLIKVSLVSNNIREIPLGMTPGCPNLSCLLLEDNPLESIPDSFFLFLNGLKFLDLTRTSIERVPDCVSHLENLSALKFSACHRLTYVPSVEKLTKLRYLYLNSCDVLNVLPEGMDKLVNLECLVLRGTDKLCVTFGKLTSGLSNIQCLELSCGIKVTQIREIERLGYLERLTGCQIREMDNFNSYVKSHNFLQLTSYQLILGSDVCGCFLDCFSDRNIILQYIKFEGGAREEAPQLPHNIQELQVLSCNFDVRSLVDTLPSLNGSTRLRRIFIFQCEGMECIWSESSCSKPTLENLEQLIISDNNCFRTLAIGRVELPPGALCSLKKLKVEYCSAVKKLFTPCLLKGQLRNLEEIEIQVCVGLEEIFAGSDVDANAEGECRDATLEVNQYTMILELPKLRVLSLIFLKKLVSICKIGLISCKCIEEITVINCPELKKLPLALELLGNGMPSAPPFLQKIHVERDWWESLEWDNLHFKQTLQPFVQFSSFSRN